MEQDAKDSFYQEREKKNAVPARIGSGQTLAKSLIGRRKGATRNVKNKWLRDKEIRFYPKWEAHKAGTVLSAKKQRE